MRHPASNTSKGLTPEQRRALVEAPLPRINVIGPLVPHAGHLYYGGLPTRGRHVPRCWRLDEADEYWVLMRKGD